MKVKTRLACGLWLSLVALAPAQQADQPQQQHPRRATEIPTEGFWPTRIMMERFIDRITADMAVRYRFSDEQLALTRQLFKARFPEFLNENRAEIQTLMNQYFEAVLNDQPPSVEAVAEWAQRMQPLLAEFGALAEEITTGMREYLDEEQQVTLDGEMAAFHTGMSLMQNKLSVWAEGGYDPQREWIRPPEQRQPEGAPQPDAPPAQPETTAPPAPQSADKGAAAAEPGTAADREVRHPKDEWTLYTERFIECYQLNEEQKQKAWMFLRHQQEQRDAHLRRNVDEMARVTRLLKEAETEEQRQSALEAYDRLNRPVERMFEELKQRLETLPTRAQRKAAVDAGRVTEEEAARGTRKARSTASAPAGAESAPAEERAPQAPAGRQGAGTQETGEQTPRDIED